MLNYQRVTIINPEQPLESSNSPAGVHNVMDLEAGCVSYNVLYQVGNSLLYEKPYRPGQAIWKEIMNSENKLIYVNSMFLDNKRSNY